MKKGSRFKILVVLFCFLFLMSTASAITDTGLQVWLEKDDATTSGAISIDSSGQQNGTIYSATTGQTGKLDEAYDYDSTDPAYIDLNSDFGLDTEDFTFATWVKYDNPPLETEPQAIGYYYGSGAFLAMVASSGVPKCRVRVSSSLDFSGTTNIKGGFHHVVCTFDRDGRGVMYVDGVVEANISISAQAGDITNNMGGSYNIMIGGDTGATPAFYQPADAVIDQTSIWLRALSYDDVQDLYNSGAGATYDDLFNPPAPANVSNFTVTVSDAYGYDLENFTVEVGGANYTSSAGTAITNIPNNATSLYDVFIFAMDENGGYYNVTEADVNVSTAYEGAAVKLVEFNSVAYSGLVAYSGVNYTRNLTYTYNYSCADFSDTVLSLFIDDEVISTSTLSCTNESVIGTGYYASDEENSYTIAFLFNTSINPAVNNGTYGVDTFRSDLYDPTPSIDYTVINGFAAGNTSVNLTCIDTVTPLLTYNLTYNGEIQFYGNKTNGTTQNNNTFSENGNNTLTGICADFFGSANTSTTFTVFYSELCLIDEQDNTLFNPLNLTRTRLYVDDNSSYFDFKLNNVSCVNYTSTDQNKLRFDLGYIGGTTITRYIDVTLVDAPVRVCANKEGVTYYEQLLISVSLTPVVMKSVYANCLIAADYTRFAYQDAYLLKAYSIETLYYLYKIVDDVQTFLASIDGSIETYVNIDNLEFRQNAVNINILTDALVFSQIDGNVTQIYYKNLRGDNVGAAINITRLDTSALVYSNNEFADPNEITILFDYSTLTGVNQSTIFRIDGFFVDADGIGHSIRQYFDANGNAGFLSSGVAFAVSFLLMIFGLTFASIRITFSWFGIIICLASIAIAAFAIPTWYITLLIVLEVIVSLYIVITMVMQGGRTIAGVS